MRPLNGDILSKIVKFGKFGEKVATFYHFAMEKAQNAAQAFEQIGGVYDEGSISKSRAREWTLEFCSGNFNIRTLR